MAVRIIDNEQNIEFRTQETVEHTIYDLRLSIYDLFLLFRIISEIYAIGIRRFNSLPV